MEDTKGWSARQWLENGFLERLDSVVDCQKFHPASQQIRLLAI